MFKIKYLRNILLVTLVIVIALPIYNLLFVYPSFSKLLMEDAEDEALRIASHWITMLNPEKIEMNAASLPDDLLMKTQKLEKDFQLKSMKVFAPSGEILYSSDQKDIGIKNSSKIFYEIVAKGHTHAQFIKKNEKIHEGLNLDADIVEIYMPLMNGSKFLGAFEIHYDISKSKENLDKLVLHASVFQFSTALGLFLVVLIVLIKAKDTIFKREASETSLAISEARYRNLVDSAKDAIFCLSRDGLLVSLNPAFETITGWSRSDWLGKHFLPLIHPDDQKTAMEKMNQLLSGEALLVFELRVLSESGQYVSVEFSTSLQRNNGEISGILGVARDVTQIRKTETLIKDILEAIDEGFVVINKEYRIIIANKAYCKESKVSLENVIGTPCYEISHHLSQPCHEVGEMCAAKVTFETGESQTSIHTHYDKEQTPYYIETKSYPMKDASGEIVSVIETFNDITEKKKLEDQLRHAQKMEAIGTLAGGIAHDFNNILNVILGFGTMALDNLEAGHPSRDHFNEVLIAAGRATNLTKSLLSFSRKQTVDLRPVYVNDIVISIKKMLSRIIGEDIDLITDLSDEKMLIMADVGQIEQVLINLAVNARHAMSSGGKLTLSSGIMELDDEFIECNGYGKPGMYALISITDTGTGMDEETRRRIFEPFFTTKEVGIGTGLGLSIVYGIIKQHKGYIKAHSVEGKGTIFNILLPLAEETAERQQRAKAVMPLEGGTETILIAEDDAALRALTKTILEAMGYNVITAKDGEDALIKFKENRDRIQLLIFDMIMPKKNGKDVYEEINRTSPDIKIIFASGYSADLISREEILEKGLSFIQKPFSPKDLLRKVREVLDK